MIVRAKGMARIEAYPNPRGGRETARYSANAIVDRQRISWPARGRSFRPRDRATRPSRKAFELNGTIPKPSEGKLRSPNTLDSGLVEANSFDL